MNIREIHQSLENPTSIYVKFDLGQSLFTVLLETELFNIIIEYMTVDYIRKLKHIMMGLMPFKIFKLFEVQINLKSSK